VKYKYVASMSLPVLNPSSGGDKYHSNQIRTYKNPIMFFLPIEEKDIILNPGAVTTAMSYTVVILIYSFSFLEFLG
jgi:hypothetical protein